MRILLIEDDPAVTLALRRGLRALYVTDVAQTGADGLHEAEVNEYDVIILDLTLPDIDGEEVCRQLRKDRNNSPILVLTARDDVRQKVSMLDAGADDYIVKPFSLEELKARIRVLARREKVAGSSRMSVGNLMLDTSTRKVSRGGEPIELRKKEFDLLEYLMHNAGRVVSRQMIIDHVWDSAETLWTNAVDVHIKYLRDKVDRPFGSNLIKTVHGVGYVLQSPSEALAGHAVEQQGDA